MTRKEELEVIASNLAGVHFTCEDCWYSCPLSSEGCCNEHAVTDCTCGATARKHAIMAALLQVEQEVWGKVITHTQRYQQFIFEQRRSLEFEAGFRTAALVMEDWLTAQQQEMI